MDDQTSDIEHLERVFKDPSAEPIKIPYAVLKSITQNFAQVIGRGGFGVVYLGGLRNGMVAVKKLSAQMDFSDTVFLDEVTNLMRLKHENIVRLLGYCADSQGEVMQVERLGYQIAEEPQRLLCFEYVPNGNVQHYLKEKSYGFEWVIRYQIIKGICQGVGYLHRERINHLDLKPENVLLGAHMVPKITDFGLSRCFAGSNSTMFTKNIIGTLGYIAPELIDRGQISSKSDIYSLGIIMIKLLLGSDEIDRDNWRESIDECCSEMKICIEIAQRCINRDPKNRPTIVEIVDQLNETELVTQDATTIINEPRHDPESSQYQVVIKFWEMFSRNIVAPSRVPDFRFRGPDYKPPPVPPTHVAKGKDDDLRLALDDHEGPVVLGNDVRKLIMWLTEDAFDNSRLKIIPIIGPKGMGKSVLAWQVYRHRSVVGRFDCRAWCNVISRTSSWPDVAAQLLDSLETRDNIGLPLWNDDKPVMELKAHLRGRRFLLVLDGLDYQPTLTAMEETLRWCPYTAGSVVVVTTCSESLVLTCDAYSFMHLKTQPSIVDAFMNRALAMVPDMPYSMAVVVRKILSRFSTDPFYMKMLIHLLYVNPSRTTQELQGLSSRLADDEPLTNAMQMFMFSYDELPSHYKSCLLYLTIFPQGCTIRRKSLIRRWVVEGLVSSTTDGLLPALEVADRCFDELLDRGFVIPVDIGAAGKVKTCRLDATVHDSITLFARQENLVDTNYLLPSTLAPRLSISNGITPQHLLKVRQANNNRNVSGWIWRTFSTKKVLSSGNSDIVVLLECLSSSQRLKLITVLDLEGCQGLERRHFKIICNKLYQLKYLCLRRTNVTRLPKDINKLRYLETLDVRETQVQDFGTEPLVLQMLKHLLAGMKKDITMSNTSFSAVYIPQCVGIMRNLQVLCHVEVSHNTELDEISHLQQLRKLGVVLNGKDVDLKHLLGTINELSSCLRSLSIRIKELPPPYWVEGLHMPDPLFKRPPKFLESLSICGLRNELPYWIQELHQLVKITLSETFLTENALRTLGQLKGLRCLRLRHNSFVATKLAFGVSEFRNLKFLVVEPTHITNISFSRKAVPKLEKIVWSFSHIQSISGIRYLERLKQFELNGPSIPYSVSEAIAAYPNHHVFKYNLQN